MIGLLTEPHLAALHGVRHGFFTREGGVSNGPYRSLNCSSALSDSPAAVAENRALVAGQFDVGVNHLFTLRQCHSTRVCVIDRSSSAQAQPEADALVTAVPGLMLGVLTADCAPVLMADSGSGVVAAVHAGWRGALGGVIEATIDVMESMGARRGWIHAAVGPCIRQPSYEVNGDFRDQFLAHDEVCHRFFIPSQRPGSFLFDLPAYVSIRLQTCGIAAGSVLPHDTYADPARFFSYRRTAQRGEGEGGRQISAIMLTGEE